MDNTVSAKVVAVQGGYRVKLGKTVHLVDKQRRCSCARKNCPAMHSVAAYLQAGGRRAPDAQVSMLRESSAACPLCGSPITGSLEQQRWECAANRDHYHVWRVARLRAAQAEYLIWLKEHEPYRYELAMFFQDADTMQHYRDEHALAYPVDV